MLELGGRAKASFFDAARALAPLLLAGRLVDDGSGSGARELLVYFSRSSYAPLPGNASSGTLVLAAYPWAGGTPAAPARVPVALPPAHSSVRVYAAALDDVLRASACPSAAACVLTLALEVGGGEGAATQVLARNHVFLAPLRAVTTMRDPLLRVTRVAAAGADSRGRQAFNVSLAKGAAGVPAAAVWLETALDGLWSDNNLLLAGPDLDAVELVWRTDDANVTAEALAASLAVSSLFDLADYGGAGAAEEEGGGEGEPVGVTAAGCAAAADTVTVTVGGAALPLALPLPGNFASLSMEVPDALKFFGPASSPNAAFANLMNMLRNVSGGAGPSIRIGGNSADTSLWWERPSQPLPPNQTYAITRVDLLAYAAALPLWAGRAVLDTNFYLQDDVTRVSDHVTSVGEFIGWDLVEGVEVGNEVEIYHDSGYRPQSWSEADYEREFVAHVAAAEAAGMPPGRIQGAVFCCNNTSYNAAFPAYASRYGGAGKLASLSYHHYAVGGCEGKVVTLEMLLADGASAGSAAFLTPFAAASRAAGLPFRVGEGNSASCGGRDGVSNVFGSALWALDTLLALAEVGVSQFNFHGGPKQGDHYTAISFPDLPNSTTPAVRPLFYGMLAATVATANGSSAWAAGVDSTNSLIKAHALRDAAGTTLRVVVVHKDLAAAAAADVSVLPAAGAAAAPPTATLLRLLAAGNNATARFGVSFAGQTFDGSTDGLPLGERVAESVPLVGGRYAFSLPPRSAAILEIALAKGAENL